MMRLAAPLSAIGYVLQLQPLLIVDRELESNVQEAGGLHP
jgi:hypothetical protein